MTAASAPAGTVRGLRPPAMPLRGSGRLLRLELRHNAMLWLLPLVGALFWYNGYREIMALPPMWNLRAMTLQNRLLLDLIVPVTAAAAWMGSREGRRDISDLLGVTARPCWSRQLATWAATTAWAEAGCLGCVAVVYGITARQASWGGPLWWPVVVSVAGVPALTAIGFAAGATFPGRFVTPLITVAVFFGLRVRHAGGLRGPLVLADLAADLGCRRHRRRSRRGHLLPLPARPVDRPGDVHGRPHRRGPRRRWAPVPPRNGPRLRIFTAVLRRRRTGAAGDRGHTGRDRPSRRARHDRHPGAARRGQRPAGQLHAQLQPHRDPGLRAPRLRGVPAGRDRRRRPEIAELAGLPGAPARISQVAEVYRQGPDNSIVTQAEGRGPSTFALPGQVPGTPGATSAEFASQLIQNLGLPLVSGVILGGGGRSAGLNPSQAELAVIGGSIRFPPSVQDA